jgi:hypothetical protein
MKGYEHTITVHDRREILGSVTPAATPPSRVYCDAEGICFFDEAPNPYLHAIIKLLDESGRDGWELVQVIPREQDLICFWRRASESREGP